MDTVAATAAALAALALVDSTSFGTLGIPVFMLIQPRVRVAALLGYLATIAGFYWLVGVVLVVGAAGLQRIFSGLDDGGLLTYAQLAVGVGLFALSFRFDKKHIAERRARRTTTGPTRRERWTEALVGEKPRAGVVMAVALAAGLVEVASMLPYLGAVGIITAANLGPLAVGGTLAAYVVVMTAPALVLLVLRLVAHRAVEPFLARLGAWLTRNADEMLGWVLGIVGFLLAADAAQRLELLHFSSCAG